MSARQQVLMMWLASSSLDSRVLGWSFFDGTGGSGPQPGHRVQSGQSGQTGQTGPTGPTGHSGIVGTSGHDSGHRQPDDPPYGTGVEALLDGWRLLQMSPLIQPTPGHERETSFLKHEFVFERMVTPAGTGRGAVEPTNNPQAGTAASLRADH